jgi:outer membrane murein-binding lipoprotein Lpp
VNRETRLLLNWDWELELSRRQVERKIGVPTTDSLRQFGIELRRLKMTPSDCASGCRIFNVVKKLGIGEENFKSFALQIYEICKSKGISAREIVEFSQQIISMAGRVPISLLPEYIDAMNAEKQSLEQELKTLREDKKTALKERDDALKNSKITIDTINEYTRTKDLLVQSGLSFDDRSEINKLVKVIDSLRGCSYEPKMMTAKLFAIDNLLAKHQKLQDNVATEEQRLNEVIRYRMEGEQRLSVCQQRLGLYYQLENLECGLKELTLLRNTIFEISSNNDIQPLSAFKKFLKDIETQYDVKLGFEEHIEETKKSLKSKQEELHSLSLECSKVKHVYDKLNELLQNGVTQNDILYWNNIVKRYTGHLSGLSDDLIQYGSLIKAKAELAAKIESLTSKYEELLAKVKAFKKRGRRVITEYSI